MRRMMARSHFEDKGQALLGRIGQTLSRVSMALIATVAAGFLVAGLITPAAALVFSDSGSGTVDTVTINLQSDVGEMFDVFFEIGLNAGCKSSEQGEGDDPDGDCSFLTAAEQTALANSTLSASLWVEITAISLSGDPGDDTIEFVLTLEDTSIFASPFFDGINSKLTSFAIDTVSDDLSAAAITNNEGAVAGFSDTDWSADIDVTFPTLGMVDACIFAGSCTGGMGFGLEPGEVDQMTLLLTGDFESDSNLLLSLSTLGIKWQTNAGEILGFDTCINGGPCFQESLETFPGLITQTVEVPEPTSLALFGIGLAGLGFMTRRRRKAGTA